MWIAIAYLLDHPWLEWVCPGIPFTMATSNRPLALVTGASVGIGKAFAEELARRGNDLVLVARNQAQLTELKDNLERRHSIQASVQVADLTIAADVADVAGRITDVDNPVDLLVNNAGRGSHGPFAEAEIDDQLGQIDLNIWALVRLTHAALSAMVPRGSGRVLNVASIAGFQPVPMESVYAATKAFVVTFTEGLYEELRGTGVTVSALCPGFTRSEFQARAGIDSRSLPSFVWQETDEVAVAGLNALEAGKAVCVPGGVNKVLGGVTRVVPRRVVRSTSGAMVRRFG